eukprot:3276873-Prymnesium_polylepis.1
MYGLKSWQRGRRRRHANQHKGRRAACASRPSLSEAERALPHVLQSWVHSSSGGTSASVVYPQRKESWPAPHTPTAVARSPVRAREVHWSTIPLAQSPRYHSTPIQRRAFAHSWGSGLGGHLPDFPFLVGPVRLMSD